MRNISDVVEENTKLIFSNVFPKVVPIMREWRNMAEPDGLGNWATDTISLCKYLLLFHGNNGSANASERDTIRTYIACLVIEMCPVVCDVRAEAEKIYDE
jgi:hypothetical protein